MKGPYISIVFNPHNNLVAEGYQDQVPLRDEKTKVQKDSGTNPMLLLKQCFKTKLFKGGVFFFNF